MKSKFLKYALRLILILSFGGISYFSWAYINDRKVSKATKAIAVAEKMPKIKYDAALLAKFETLSKHLDPNRSEYNLTGKLVFRDGSDSAAKAQQLVYEVRKRDTDYYCRLGSTEILNANGTSVSIDHFSKQIIVSGQKELPVSQLFPSTKELLKNLQKERYVLSGIVEGGEEKLQLLNNYHITCKEYTITYDKETFKPVKLFTRLTNFENPESREKERVVTLYIDRCESQSRWYEIEQKKFVSAVGAGWHPVEKYKNYKLHVL